LEGYDGSDEGVSRAVRRGQKGISDSRQAGFRGKRIYFERGLRTKVFNELKPNPKHKKLDLALNMIGGYRTQRMR